MRRARMITGAAAAAVTAVVTLATVRADVRDDDRRAHNVESVDSLQLFQDGRATARPVELGMSGSGSMVVVFAQAPVTILSARPYRTTDVDLVASRALFQGQTGTRSPGGYTQLSGSWLSDCVRRITGYGPTYPVEGLRLAKGDALRLVWYYTPRSGGQHVLTGYRIVYRTATGEVRTVTGDRAKVEMAVLPAGTPNTCGPRGSLSGIAEPAPGFPP